MSPRTTPSTRPGYRRAETVNGLFAWCVRRWPDATALVHGERSITYQDLDALSDDYAVELAQRGVGPGDNVPVLAHRDIEMVAVLLAVLKRGAVCATLDPGWPAGRVTELIGRLAPRVVVAGTGEWTLPTWAPTPGAPGLGRRPPEVPVTGDDPAFVFFTSGSTGRPKGVVIPHVGAARLYDECVFSDFGPGAVQAQTMPMHWDGSVMDLWSTLLCGGTTVFVDEVLHPALLRRLVRDNGVNTTFLPTAMFNMIVDEDIEAFRGMRQVNFGGEKASQPRCRRFLDQLPDVRLTNMYGPVESTGIVTSHPVTVADTTIDTGVPIGSVLTHTGVHVLDGDRPCAPGEVGELCLSGDGLALGYLGDPELTARQFVTLATPAGPLRVYRTGDLGTMTDDGVVHYRGRTDQQVKIRSHRIEPGEVERTAEQVPGVARAAVVVLRDDTGTPTDLRLCFVPRPGASIDAAELGTALAALLPSYLLPGQIRKLDELPLNSNGKIDRRALATDDPAPDAPAEPSRATATQALIAATCSAVLGRPVTDLTVPLRHQGLNSLDMARVCARLMDATGVTIPLSQFYRTSNITDLAGWLDNAGRPVDQPEPGTRPGPIPLTTGQLNYVGVSDRAGCLLPWWIDGPLDLVALRAALGDLHRRHQALHAHYRRTPPGLTVPDRPGEPELSALPDVDDEPAALAALFGALHQPLDITAGRVWRAATVRVAGGRSLLGLAVHHVAFDGWSHTPLVTDLGTAYAARVAGRAPVWPRQVPGLAEVAREHRRRLAAVDLDAQRDYWRARLHGLPRLRLPGVGAWDPGTAGPITGRVSRLSPAELAPWDELVTTGRATRYGALVAAFGATLRRLTGQSDIGMLGAVAARGNPLLDRTVTCRTNPVCLRLRRPRSGPAGDPVAEAMTAVNEALAAQDLPFGEVIAAMSATGPFDSVVRTLPVFLVQDDDLAPLRLLGATTEFVQHRSGVDSATVLAVEVLPDADGATLRVGARTDAAPADLADTVTTTFREILRAGPPESR